MEARLNGTISILQLVLLATCCEAFEELEYVTTKTGLGVVTKTIKLSHYVSAVLIHTVTQPSCSVFTIIHLIFPQVSQAVKLPRCRIRHQLSQNYVAAHSDYL